MRSSKHKFIRGITRDTSQDSVDNNTLYHAVNTRVMKTDDSTYSSLTNLEGNRVLITQADRDTFVPVGSIQFDIYTVVFYAEEGTSTPSPSTTTYIDLFRYSATSGYTRYNLWNGTGLGLHAESRISGVGRVETSSTIKIYWADSENNVRFANIAPDTPGGSAFTRIQGLDSTDFELMNSINFNLVQFQDYIGGALQSGVIQYSYRLSKKSGVETPFSPVSTSISLSSTIRQSNTNNIFGNDVNVNTGLGVSGYIQLDPTVADDYDFIEIVALYYTSKNVTPTISVVGLFSINSADVYFTDVGSYEGTIDSSEYNLLSTMFSAESLETKDNILFAANTEDDVFDLDIDMRIYRYYDAGGGTYRCDLFNNNGQEMLVNTAPSANWDLYTYNAGDLYDRTSYILDTAAIYTTSTIPADFDCTNAFNLKQNDSVTEQYKYQAAGGSIGGTGLNASFITLTDEYVIENNLSVTTLSTTVSTSLQKDYIRGRKRSYKRDEIYRFGVVFFDDKGRPSPTKWMCDIRMPDNSEAIYFEESAPNEVSAYALRPFFSLSLVGTEAEGLDFVIVRAIRSESDRTILGQGILAQSLVYTPSSPDSLRGSIVTEFSNNARYNGNRKIVDFISPGYLIANDINFVSGDYIKGIVKASDYDEVKDPNTWSGNENEQAIKYLGSSPYSTIKDPILGAYLFDPLDSFAEFVDASDSTEIDGTDYEHWHELKADGSANYGIKPTTMVLDLTFAPDNTGFSNRQVPIVDYVRDITPYGGITYESRLNTEYIQCSDLSNGNAYYGDTFICMFPYLRWIYTPDASSGRKGNLSVAFPVESYYNLFLESETNFFKVPSTAEAKRLIRETAGAYDDDTGGSYIQEFDRYTYNDVYNTELNSRLFVERGINDPEEEKFETRIRYSDTKINGELLDSWTKFRTNNYNEAEATYGPVNNMVAFQNQLYIFQSSGVSLASVNTRVTQIGDDGITTVLGQGSILDYFNYITTELGIQDNCDIVKTPSAIHWIDTNRKKWYSLDGNGLNALSVVNGVQSWFNKAFNNNSSITGIYDYNNNEVLFSNRDKVRNPISSFTDLGSGLARLSYALKDGGRYTLFRKGRELFMLDINKDFGFYKVENITPTDIDLRGTEYNSIFATEIADDVDMSYYTYEPFNGTFVYSEKSEGFMYWTWIADLFIKATQDIFSWNNTTQYPTIYIHDDSDSLVTNTYFGERVESTVDIMAYTMDGSLKEYDALAINMEVYDSTGALVDDQSIETVTVDNIEAYSDELLIREINKVHELFGANNTIYDTNATNDIVNSSTLYNARKVGSNWHMPLPRQVIDDISYPTYSGITTYNIGDIVEFVQVGNPEFKGYYICKVNGTLGVAPSGSKLDNANWDYYEVRDRIRGNYARVRLKLNTTQHTKINSVEIIYDTIII